MTRRAWTALSAGTVFVLCLALILLIPVPFVAWEPGNSYNVFGKQDDKPLIEISGLETYPVSGKLHLTTVSVTSVDSDLTLPVAVVDYWLPDRDVLPRDSVYPPGKSAAKVKEEEVQMMDTSQNDAIVAALRAAGQPVSEHPMVSGIVVSGPANGLLETGDLILMVNGVAVKSMDDVRKEITRLAVGKSAVFQVLRKGKEKTVSVATVASVDDKKVPVVGIQLTRGYSYAPRVTYGLGKSIVGPSGGLPFALAIYDMITPNDLIDGRVVAATGVMSPNGEVGAIGAIREKVATASRDGASVFIFPKANCRDLSGFETDMTLVPVSNLAEATSALQKLSEPGGKVPGC